MEQELRRKSQVLWGVGLIALMFLLETWNADRVRPNPASPYVWAFLAFGAVASVVGALHFARRARSAAAKAAQAVTASAKGDA